MAIGGSHANAAGGTRSGTSTSTQFGGNAGASATGGASAVANGVVATLGAFCTPPGKLACAGNYQKLTLVCGGSNTWEVNQTCSVGQFCESTAGVNAGLCRAELAECEGKPNLQYCADVDSLYACSADAVAKTLVETCSGRCYDGKCDPLVDPCPTTTAISYSTDCKGAPGVSTVAPNLCKTSTPSPHPSFIVRMPRSPLTKNDCPLSCSDGSYTYQTLQLAWGPLVRVTVGLPWQLAAVQTTYDLSADEAACSGPRAVQCLLATSEQFVVVYSGEAMSLPRNVLVEPASATVHCGTPPAACDLLPSWVPGATVSISGGDRLKYQGTIYEYSPNAGSNDSLTYAMTDCTPGASAAWCPWTVVGTCP